MLIDDAITARKLTKRFDSLTAVNGIDFSVHAGECFGLLGPNGAGKTSTVKMIYGFSPVTSGKLTVLGQDIMAKPRGVKARLGVVAQEDNLDPELTVRENLLVYAAYFRLSREAARTRAAEILSFMGLEDKTNEVVENLSGGLKRRLTIGRALINQPELLILDEPTTGLDPYARRLVWQRLRQLKESGTTMLLTTHYLEEASQLCDRLLILHHGEILEQGSPAELVQKHVGREALELGLSPSQNNVTRENHKIPKDWVDTFLSWGGPLVKSHQVLGDDLIIFTQQGEFLSAKLRKRAVAAEISLSNQRLRPTTLEDVFLKLTGESLDTAEGEEKE
ncbi:MAG: ABC transporter ATP-binding protein [Desulfitobacteriaceae bacterium]